MYQGFEGKRVVITGATGLIGGKLATELIKANADVIVLGRNEDKIKDVFNTIMKKSNFSYRVIDVSRDMLCDLGTVDYFLHAASPIAGSEIKTRPLNVINANLQGMISGLEYLKKQKVNTGISGKMIVFSSATVYGHDSMNERIVTEEETVLAANLDSQEAPYSESKRMIEVIARAYAIQHKIDINIVRIGYVYGCTKYYPNTAFYEFITKAINGENIILNSNCSAKRDNIYVDDVVRGIITICQKADTGEVYNISSNGDGGHYLAADEIAELIAKVSEKVLQHKIEVIYNSNVDEGRKPGIRLQNRKIKELGWKIETDIESGIEQTIRAFQDMN